MAALTQDRNTPERNADEFTFDMAAATTIFAGSLVALDASGNLVKGTTAVGLIAAGRAQESKTNSGAAGAEKLRVKKGAFRWANSAAADLITKAEIGDDCYIVDDQTVAKTSASSTRSRAGRVVDVDALGVWVATGLGL